MIVGDGVTVGVEDGSAVEVAVGGIIVDVGVSVSGMKAGIVVLVGNGRVADGLGYNPGKILAMACLARLGLAKYVNTAPAIRRGINVHNNQVEALR